MTPDPYKALRGQASALKRHDKQRHELTSHRDRLVQQLRADGYPIRQIALAAELSRETIYQITKDTT